MATLKSSKTNSTYNTDTGMVQVPGQAPIQPIQSSYNPNAILNNTDAQNQLLANRNPEAFDNAANLAGFSTSPTVPVNNTVPVATTGAQPLSIANTPTNTSTAGLLGAAASTGNLYQQQMDALKQQQAQTVQQNQTAANDSRSVLQKTFDKLAGFGERRNDIYEEENVDEFKKLETDALNQLNVERDALQSQIENINSQKGTFGGANQRDIAEVSRQSAIKQGRLTLTLSLANGNYTNAKATADRLIESELEPLKIQSELAKFFYQDNKDTLDKSEARQFETYSRELQNQYTEQYESKKKVQDMIIDAAQTGAPASVIQQAQQLAATGATPEQVSALVGKYSSAALDAQAQRASIANTYSAIAERQQSQYQNGTLNGKPQNTTQATAQTYANRMAEANIALDSLGGKFTGLGTSASNLLGGLVPGFLKGGDRQSVEQAQKNFVTAILRRESGASISPTEFDTAADIYFPRPGDKPATIEQKAVTRNAAINNFYKEANVARPVLPGQIISSGGKKYQVGTDGETLEEI